MGVVSRKWVWVEPMGVVVRRYIDFLLLLIPTPLVYALFCSSIPFIKKNVFPSCSCTFVIYVRIFFAQYKRLFLHVTCRCDYVILTRPQRTRPLLLHCVILCHCTLAAALYFEQSSCDELMEFKQIQTRAQPEESLKHNHSCTNLSPE